MPKQTSEDKSAIERLKEQVIAMQTDIAILKHDNALLRKLASAIVIALVAMGWRALQSGSPPGAP